MEQKRSEQEGGTLLLRVKSAVQYSVLVVRSWYCTVQVELQESVKRVGAYKLLTAAEQNTKKHKTCKTEWLVGGLRGCEHGAHSPHIGFPQGTYVYLFVKVLLGGRSVR